MRKPPIAIAILSIIALAAVISTWSVFSQTSDEPFHIGCGLEWLGGRFSYEYQHPPFARVLTALGLYLDGQRFRNITHPSGEGNVALYDGDYTRNLSLARAGTLPFLILAIVIIALWTRRDFGALHAVVAVLLFVTLPPVLAHAGLATTDMAAGATIPAATYALRRWLDQPTLTRAIVVGLLSAAALLSKLSALVYLPPLFLLLVVMHRMRPASRAWIRHGAMAMLLCFLAVWGTFRFNVQPVLIEEATQYDPAIPERLQPLAHKLGRVPIPAPEMLRGLGELAEHSAFGHAAYFRGEYRQHGWIDYFPVTLAIKTPIPILLLALASLPLLWRDRQRVVAPVAAILVLLVAMTSSINIGIRHILPLYPFLAIAAAATAVFMWQQRHVAFKLVVTLLIVWQCVNATAAHPDHLAWFNEIADDEPEYWLNDSNLDWGQDLLRLRDEVRARGISSLGLSYFGTADPQKHGFPPLLYVDPDFPSSSGWIAVSTMNRYGLGINRSERAFGWLEGYPSEKIGTSIRLYRVPEMLLTAGEDRIETILLPLLIGPEPLRTPRGNAYLTEAVIHSTHREPVTISAGPMLTQISPGSQKPSQLIRTATGGTLMRIPIDAAAAVTVAVTLRNTTDGTSQPIPAVRVGDVPTGPRLIRSGRASASRTLRIYDVSRSIDGWGRITVSRGEKVVLQKKIGIRRVEAGGPSYQEVDFNFLEGDLRIVLEPGSDTMRLWPLLVEVDPATEAITLRTAE